MNNKTRHQKIMLIDDDPDDRKYFAGALNEINAGIELVTAKDGEQGLELLNQADALLPDFIFLDLRMPRIGGRQCLLKIKAQERLRHIPVIVYTTSRDVGEADTLIDLGAVHFITKPSHPDEIYYMISLVLEERWYDHKKLH